MPSKSTLNKRVQNLDCEPGLLHSILSVMKAKTDTMPSLDELSVLSFDEMSLAKKVELRQREGCFI